MAPNPNPNPPPVWNRLGLALSLQSKDLSPQRKLELAFDFVSSKAAGGPEPLGITNLAAFVGGWVQNLLTSKISENWDPCLDVRCWEILKFCLDNSSFRISAKFLGSVTRVLRNALVRLDGDGLYGVVLECVDRVFGSDRGVICNAHKDWISCAEAAFDVINRVFGGVGDAPLDVDVVPRISCVVLERFCSFLRLNPNLKQTFVVFVDCLLESSLESVVLLRQRTQNVDCDLGKRLLVAVEDVMLNGLFHSHPAHISGFLSLRSSHLKNEGDGSVGLKESYHMKLFRKVKKITSEKKSVAVLGLGHLFHLFTSRVKKKKEEFSEQRKESTEQDVEDTCQPLFEVFMLFMKPIMALFKKFLDLNFNKASDVCDPSSLELHRLLKSSNGILAVMLHEKIYSRSTDTNEGANYYSLKELYDTVIAISAKVCQLPLPSSVVERECTISVIPLVKELVVTVGYLLEIEFKILGDDLVTSWLLILSSLTICTYMKEFRECSLLVSNIFHLGCQIIKLFTDVRQVTGSPIFALFKAVRIFFSGKKSEADNSLFLLSKSLSLEACLESVEMLFLSQEYRTAISSAIKSIPEGQVSIYIGQLKLEIADFLTWIRSSVPDTDKKSSRKRHKPGNIDLDLNLRAAVLGILSEPYTTLLDALTVTTSNSNSVGNSIQDLITTLSPSFSSLTTRKSSSINDFFYFVTGRKFIEYGTGSVESNADISWILLFFFRMYISCRSLYKEAISLMPHNSKKAASAMGCLFTVRHGENWIGKTEWRNNDYFSWLVVPCHSLTAIIEILSRSICFSSSICHTSLVYVLHTMVLQRLTDLNSQISGFEFLHEKEDNLLQIEVLDDAVKSQETKENRWKKLLKVSRKEASELTGFLMSYLPSKQLSHWSDLCRSSDAWDFCVCSLNEKSFPTALWWLLCRNIDIWCAHAESKMLETFSSLLIHSAVLHWQNTKETKGSQDELRCELTINHISAELMMDTVYYEQKPLFSHLIPSFLCGLKESVSPLLSFAKAANVDFEVLPDYSTIKNTLCYATLASRNAGHGSQNGSSLMDSSGSPTTFCEDYSGLKSSDINLETCHGFLNLICRVLRFHVNVGSVSLLTTYIINLERLVISSLIECHGGSIYINPLELLRLFVSCRRALRYIALTSLEDNSVDKKSYFWQNFDENAFSISWFFESVAVVLALPHFASTEHYAQMKQMFFVLMDQTSYLYLILSKWLLIDAMSSIMKDCMRNAQNSGVLDSDSLHHVNSWKHFELVSEKLKEQIKELLVFFEGNAEDLKLEPYVGDALWIKVSNMVSSLQGLIWGIASGLSICKKIYLGMKQQLVISCVSELYNRHIHVYEVFLNICLKMLLFDRQSAKYMCKSITQELDSSYLRATFRTDDGYHNDGVEKTSRNQFDGSLESIDLAKPDSGIHRPCITKKRKLQENSDTEDNAGSAIDLLDSSELPDTMLAHLKNILKGEDPEMAFFIRQLFISGAAILKLRRGLSFQVCMTSTDHGHSTLSSTGILVKASCVLLELGKSGVLNMFSYIWLDGTLKFLNQFSHYISSATPVGSRNTYMKLIDIHLRAIGKCISLQGRAATLASHEIVSNTKMLHSEPELCEIHSFSDHEVNSLNEFKARLRVSFRKFIRRPLKLHFSSAIQALERALVGVQQDCSTIYDISTGDLDGGRVSPTVAAGVDCLDLVLEFASGKKYLGIMKKHIQTLVRGVSNIIAHLENPLIFYLSNMPEDIIRPDPDPGSVILMCVEVLTKVAGKSDMLEMDACFVSHSLHLPMKLFHNFRKLKNSHHSRLGPQVHASVVDGQFSVDLYASCCKLLCTTLRHRTRESRRCIALLVNSVNVLLVCLEGRSADLIGENDSFAWEISEAVKCATFLRRVYEEMKQQKDLMGRYSSLFLSTYISVASRLGPTKSGIEREVEKALEPGVFALLDICQPSDLQQLHTVLGEGPCQRKLARLQDEYKLQFQYEGKI